MEDGGQPFAVQAVSRGIPKGTPSWPFGRFKRYSSLHFGGKSMERKKRTKRKNRGKRFSRAAVIGLTFAVTGIAACAGVYFVKKDGRETPEELLVRYMGLIEQNV